MARSLQNQMLVLEVRSLCNIRRLLIEQAEMEGVIGAGNTTGRPGSAAEAQLHCTPLMRSNQLGGL
jgi:hypothetical protein